MDQYGSNLHRIQFNDVLVMLCSDEDNSKLSATIAKLAEADEKDEKVHEQQAKVGIKN